MGDWELRRGQHNNTNDLRDDSLLYVPSLVDKGAHG